MIGVRIAKLEIQDGQAGVSVKSLSMDSWSNDQVDTMKKIGNTTSNRVFNPKNSQPPVPLDVDEVDAAMEKFIRQKYDQRTFSGGKTTAAAARAPVRHDTGSSDDQPPPPPPKPGRRFGFGLRSASSALPLSRNYDESPPPSADIQRKSSRAPSPIRINKQSRVFGASIGVTEDGMEWKLVQLKEMGFPDDKRNSNILKGLNGDLERAIESLVRLGEGTTPASRTRTPNSARFPEVNRPKQITSESRAQQAPASAPPTGAMQMQQPPQPQVQAQGSVSGNLSSPMPANQSYNPFENLAAPSAQFQQAPLENAFQNMHITQPLFPNATGGYPNQQQQLQQARALQSMTPPVPQLPHQFSYNNLYATQQTTPSYNPFINQTKQQSQPMSANPFLPSQQAQQPSSANSFMPTKQTFTSNQTFMSNQQTFTPPQQTFTPHNLYQTQPSMNEVLSQPSQNQYQQPQQQPQVQWSQQQSQPTYQESPQQLASPHSFGQPLQSPQFVQSPAYPFTPNYQNQFQTPVQSIQPQQTGRFDKSSILALYKYPQLAPPPLPQDANGSNAANSMSPSPQPQAAKLPQGVSGLGQRSATMPATSFSGSKNPFASSLTPTSPVGPSQMNGGVHQANQESIDAGALQNGRHSPDAFASLSARFVR
ncbi:hypothetical protein MMC30_004663 [Trapelia coarctata]|nr:hypothetical protein [Trapelia coarctata]